MLLSWFKLSAPVVTVVIVSRSSVEYFCSCILLLRNWVLFGTGILEPSVMAAESYVWHKLTLWNYFNPGCYLVLCFLQEQAVSERLALWLSSQSKINFFVYFQPEWYLTQVLMWMGNNSTFMEETIQPILDRGGVTLSAKVCFLLLCYNSLIPKVWA